MAQVVPPEILTVLAYRPQYKAAGRRSVLSNSSLAMIDSIRVDIPSGEDGDGWSSVCRNWRSGGSSRSAPIGAGSGGHNGAGHSNGNNRYQDRSAPEPNIGSSFKKQQGQHRSWDVRKTIPPTAMPADERPRFTNTTLTSATVAAPASVTHTVAPPTSSSQKYTSRYKPADEPVESTIVNTIILNKLNKFSPANYEEVKEFLMEILGSGETDFLTDFMRLVFRKAAAEETFCSLYAKLLNELSIGYPFLLNEMKTLYESYMNIFQEVAETDYTNMEEFIQKNKEKKYRQGYSQFLAELLKQGIVEQAAFVNTIKTIVKQMKALSREVDKSNTLEEYSNCLLRIFRVLKGNSDVATAIRASVADPVKEELTVLTVCSPEYPSLTNRIRFSVMNALECINV